MFRSDCGFANRTKACWPDDGEDILDDSESSHGDPNDINFLSKLFSTGKSSDFNILDGQEDDRWGSNYLPLGLGVFTILVEHKPSLVISVSNRSPLYAKPMHHYMNCQIIFLIFIWVSCRIKRAWLLLILFYGF